MKKILKWVVETPTVAVSLDPASVTTGRHVMQIHLCEQCHGENLAGQVFLDIPSFLSVAPNLTLGTGGR